MVYDVIFINPPITEGKKKRFSFPPLGVLYIATFIKNKGFSVKFVDALVDGTLNKELVQMVTREKPLMVGFSAMTCQIINSIKIAEGIKSLNSGIKVVIGGPHISSTTDELYKFSDKFDFLIYKEGEYPFYELLKAIKNKTKNFNEIKGLIYKNEEGNVIKNPSGEPIEDISRSAESEAGEPIEAISGYSESEAGEPIEAISGYSEFLVRKKLFRRKFTGNCFPPAPLKVRLYFALQTQPAPQGVLAAVGRALAGLGWEPEKIPGTWNLLWTWSQPIVDFSRLEKSQKVNHFLGNKFLTRKDFLRRSHDRHLMSGESEICPQTFLLPRESKKFLDAFEETPGLWILKPVWLSRGRGVKLVSEISDVTYSRPVVIQRYILNPLLLNSFKFDLRVYVVVCSFEPLRAFIHRKGFARLATVPYSTRADSLSDRCMHLTNVAVQKEGGEEGTKITLDELRSSGCLPSGQFDAVVWPRVKEVALKTVRMGQGNVKQDTHSFELFGFDMLIEADTLKVWLLEVNASPSLALDTLLDEQIKIPVIQDVVRLVTCENLEIQTLEKL